jgi:hypothetical protein
MPRAPVLTEGKDVGFRRLPLLASAVLMLSALVAVTPAAAGTDADARATASRFLDAMARGDAAVVCSMFSPAALARLGGEDECHAGFTDTDSADREAMSTLVRAFEAARKSADRRRAGYVTKKFTARALARDMERIDSELTVKLGRNAKAASNQLVTTAVLDVRTNARRLVLYAESDDGSILRLSVPRHGDGGSLEEVAQGVAETAPRDTGPAFAFTVDSVAVVDATVQVRATIRITLADETYSVGVLLVLVPGAGGSYLVDDMLVSTIPVASG